MSKASAVGGITSEHAQTEVATEQTTGSVLETGDVFVADTGEYVGKWEGKALSVPMELAMVVGSFEYIYKLDRRERRDGEGTCQ